MRRKGNAMEILNLAEITVEVSALILFISLIRALFRKKSNPNVRYFLWLFVALRVLLPFKLFIYSGSA